MAAHSSLDVGRGPVVGVTVSSYGGMGITGDDVVGVMKK